MTITRGEKVEWDYIILGQGVAGTFLSWCLIKQGKKVLVIDIPKSNSASQIASGVINPVTGRRVVQTWKIDDLLPFAKASYEQISAFLGIPSVLTDCSVLDFHSSEQMKTAFDKRLYGSGVTDRNSYLYPVEDLGYWERFFEFKHSAGEVRPALLIDLENLLKTFRKYLRQTGCLSEAVFDWGNLELLDDNQGVVYHLDGQRVCATKILCCEGIGVQNNPYFKELPFRFNKGQALIVAIDDLPRKYIYKLKYSLVPWGQENLFWVGSTYEWEFESEKPTKAFKAEVEAALKTCLKVPFQIKGALAGIRPASMQRRPFVGLHPQFPAVGILNGLGTKGCSLGPFYSAQLADFLENGGLMDVEAAVKRCF